MQLHFVTKHTQAEYVPMEDGRSLIVYTRLVISALSRSVLGILIVQERRDYTTKAGESKGTDKVGLTRAVDSA